MEGFSRYVIYDKKRGLCWCYRNIGWASVSDMTYNDTFESRESCEKAIEDLKTNHSFVDGLFTDMVPKLVVYQFQPCDIENIDTDIYLQSHYNIYPDDYIIKEE